MSLAIGTTLLFVFATSGMTMRYEVDFATFFLLPAVFAWYALFVSEGRWTFVRRRVLPAVFVLLCAIGAFLQVCFSFTGYYNNLKTFNPAAYARLRLWSAPLERLAGAPAARILEIADPGGSTHVGDDRDFWLGGPATQIRIASDRARNVTMTAQFTPGPSTDPSRIAHRVRMMVTGWREPQELFFRNGVESITFHVPAGESLVTLEVLDAAVKPPPPFYPYPVMMGVRDLRVTPATK